MTFASLARTHDHARVLNVRDFPQAKLESKINARFHSNENGHSFFLMHEFKEHKAVSHISRFEESLKFWLDLF